MLGQNFINFRKIDYHIIYLEGFPQEIDIGYGSADPEPFLLKPTVVDYGDLLTSV